jgi:hypothetical protein
LLLAVQTKVATPDQPGSISIFSEDGKSVRVLPLQPGTSVLAVAGARIFVQGADGSLKAIRRDGSVETLGTAGTAPTGIGGLIPSPDGKRWLWASQTADSSSQSVYLAGDELAMRTLATFPYPTVLVAYAWTPNGIFLDSLPMDYFGYRPFNTTFGAFGGVRRLDPNSGTIQTVGTPSQCIFSDEAADGAIACFPTATGYLVPTLHAVRIVASAGHVRDLSLAVPRFNFVGDAFFSPDGSMLTVAGATGVGDNAPQSGNTNPKPEQYATDIVQTADGSISRFGPNGTRPAMGRQSWLPDGQLVLWRPDSVGGAPGLYVLDPHGTGQGSEIEVFRKPNRLSNGLSYTLVPLLSCATIGLMRLTRRYDLKESSAGVLLAFVLAACGTSHTVSPAPAMSPSPTTSKNAGVLFGVLEAHPFPNGGSPAYDTVAVVGLDSIARAKTTLTPITPPNLGDLGPLLPPQAYAAAGRVYFLDGKGAVQSLATDGKVALITTFPAPSAQREVSFAVSPDGRALIGTVTTFSSASTAAVAIDVYAAAPGQAPTLLRHQQGGPGLSFIGWDSIGPIGTDPTGYGTQGGPASHWFGTPVRVDARGNTIGPLGGAGCLASDVAADGTVACLEVGGSSGFVSVRDSNGHELWRSSPTNGGYLNAFISPDHQHVVAFDGGSSTSGAVILGPGASKVPAADILEQGWFDNQTVVGWVPYPELGLIRVSDPKRVVDLGFKGSFVGVLRAS